MNTAENYAALNTTLPTAFQFQVFDREVAVGFRAGIQFYKKQVSLEMFINSTSQNSTNTNSKENKGSVLIELGSSLVLTADLQKSQRV